MEKKNFVALLMGIVGGLLFSLGMCLYTDMNAIRRDEEMDNLHSIYTDQWDWEKIITRETRTLTYLKNTVKGEVGAICDTLDMLKVRYPQITVELDREVSFITSQELEDMYPHMTTKERENAYVKERLGKAIDRTGADKLEEALFSDDLMNRKEEILSAELKEL